MSIRQLCDKVPMWGVLSSLCLSWSMKGGDQAWRQRGRLASQVRPTPFLPSPEGLSRLATPGSIRAQATTVKNIGKLVYLRIQNCASRGTVNTMKRQPPVWEETFANQIADKGLLIYLEHIKKTPATQQKERKRNPIKKVNKGLE